MLVQTNEAITPTYRDTQIARASSEALAPLLQDIETGKARVRLSTEGGREDAG